MKNILATGAVAALLGVSGVAVTTTSASAAIVCNQENECWHVRDKYEYKPEFGVTVHEDNWQWQPTEHYTWREHEGRGYWRNGAWITF
jgi:hypothetical protein